MKYKRNRGLGRCEANRSSLEDKTRISHNNGHNRKQPGDFLNWGKSNKVFAFLRARPHKQVIQDMNLHDIQKENRDINIINGEL